LRQRVQGVVDVCGARKASFAVPGQESGPVESLTVRNRLNVLHLTRSTPYRPVQLCQAISFAAIRAVESVRLTATF